MKSHGKSISTESPKFSFPTVKKNLFGSVGELLEFRQLVRFGFAPRPRTKPAVPSPLTQFHINTLGRRFAEHSASDWMTHRLISVWFDTRLKIFCLWLLDGSDFLLHVSTGALQRAWRARRPYVRYHVRLPSRRWQQQTDGESQRYFVIIFYLIDNNFVCNYYFVYQFCAHFVMIAERNPCYIWFGNRKQVVALLNFNWKMLFTYL